jgi:hypothetical protein
MENNGIDNFRHFNSIEFTQISLRKINYVLIVDKKPPVSY